MEMIKKFIFLFIFLQSSLYANDFLLTLAAPESSIYSNEDLLNGGLFPEIVRNSLGMMGYDIEIEYLPWKRALTMTKNSHFDGLLVVSFTEERDDFFHYSDIVLFEEGVFLCLKGKYQSYSKLEDLKNNSIGSIRGSLISSLLKVEGLAVKDVASHDQNIRKLLAGRIDFIAANKYTIQRLLERDYPEQSDYIAISGPVFYKGSLHFVVPENHPDSEKIISDFNRGLKLIKENGVYDGILARHGFSKN